jgi:CheY-like chemotaxis protein
MTEILLVADSPWVADAVAAALSGGAYRVSAVTASSDAVEAWQQHEPAAVLIDLQIGSRGGMAVVRDLRAAAQAAGVAPPPMVLLLDRGVDAFLARRSGADRWIRKPFTGFALRRLVGQLTPAGRAGAAAT